MISGPSDRTWSFSTFDDNAWPSQLHSWLERLEKDVVEDIKVFIIFKDTVLGKELLDDSFAYLGVQFLVIEALLRNQIVINTRYVVLIALKYFPDRLHLFHWLRFNNSRHFWCSVVSFDTVYHQLFMLLGINFLKNPHLVVLSIHYLFK